MRQAPKRVFRSKSSIPLGSARLSCLSLNNLPPSPALYHGSRFTSCSMDDVAPLLSPESFFRSQNKSFNVFRSTVLSCLRNSSTRRFSVKRTSYFIGLPSHTPYPKPFMRRASSPQNAFFALRHDRNVLLVSQSSLSLNNLPPARDTRDGTRVLPGLLPRTRFSLQKPPPGNGDPIGMRPTRHAYTRMRTRPPAPTRKRTTHKKFTIAYI